MPNSHWCQKYACGVRKGGEEGRAPAQRRWLGPSSQAGRLGVGSSSFPHGHGKGLAPPRPAPPRPAAGPRPESGGDGSMTRGPRMAQRALRSSTVSPSLLSPQGFSLFCAEKKKARGTGRDGSREKTTEPGRTRATYTRSTGAAGGLWNSLRSYCRIWSPQIFFCRVKRQISEMQSCRSCKKKRVSPVGVGFADAGLWNGSSWHRRSGSRQGWGVGVGGI